MLSEELEAHVSEGKELLRETLTMDRMIVHVIGYDDDLRWIKLTVDVTGTEQFVLDPLSPTGARLNKKIRESVAGVTKEEAFRIVKTYPKSNAFRSSSGRRGAGDCRKSCHISRSRRRADDATSVISSNGILIKNVPDTVQSAFWYSTISLKHHPYQFRRLCVPIIEGSPKRTKGAVAGFVIASLTQALNCFSCCLQTIAIFLPNWVNRTGISCRKAGIQKKADRIKMLRCLFEGGINETNIGKHKQISHLMQSLSNRQQFPHRSGYFSLTIIRFLSDRKGISQGSAKDILRSSISARHSRRGEEVGIRIRAQILKNIIDLIHSLAFKNGNWEHDLVWIEESKFESRMPKA